MSAAELTIDLSNPREKALTRRGTPRKNELHGMTHAPEYQVWRNMLARCFNPKTRMYAAYGGRGITVCQLWQDSFSAFIADVGPRPSDKHSIERINSNGNYEPGNVKWATKVEQQNNLRKSVKITYRGETHGIREWSRITGIHKNTLDLRIKRGWPIDDVFSAPDAHRRHHG